MKCFLRIFKRSAKSRKHLVLADRSYKSMLHEHKVLESERVWTHLDIEHQNIDIIIDSVI